MNIAAKGLRRGPLLVLLALSLVTIGVVALVHSTSAPADFNDNATCKGHIAKGAGDPNDSTVTGVQYTFSCSGPITGYSILSDKEVQGMDTEIVVVDNKGAVVPSDSFGCQGEIPGYGVNCNGVYGADQRVISGQFFINEKICAERRVDPILTVAYATSSNGKLTQSIAGPFDLGRPRGCKPSKYSGKTHIPSEQESVAPDQGS